MPSMHEFLRICEYLGVTPQEFFTGAGDETDRINIIPYFEPLGVTLAGLQPRQIQSFYLHEAETLKNTSILRFHANLHKALKYAVRIDLIASNPVDKVDLSLIHI